MNILIDIGHPAHVHLFRNLALEMQKKGHVFHFTVREGEHESALLKKYGFNYTIIGKKQKGILKKVLGILIFTFRILRASGKFKPDLFLSHGSMYAGYAALLSGKKHIALEDTGNMEQLIFSKPVSDIILSPMSLQVDLGKKHIRYKGFHELAYLHPSRFSPDEKVLEELGVAPGEKFVILRFVSWNASHDLGQSGMNMEYKALLINKLSAVSKVFISGENHLPAEFEKNSLRISPHRFNDALYFASLYVGEGATSASECAMLGTPAIYISSISPGTLKEQERFGLVHCFRDPEGLIEKALEILQMNESKTVYRTKKDIMLKEMIDVTSFLTWFVEFYPQSKSSYQGSPFWKE